MNMSVESMKLSYNKAKAVKLFFGSIAFVIMGIIFIIYPEKFSRYSSTFTSVIGYIAVAFFGLGIFASTRMFFQKNPNFEMNSEGITYDVKKSSSFIAWKDIQGFSEVKIHRQKIVVVHLRNPEEYIEREKNPLKKRIMEFNYKNFDSPISILPSMYNLSLDQLLANLEKYNPK